MKAKDIEVGKIYRITHNMHGTSIYAALVLDNAVGEQRWDRKTMGYKTVVTQARVSSVDSYGNKREELVRLNAFIELWDEFAERMPEQAAKYELQLKSSQWAVARNEHLNEICPESLKPLNGNLMLRGGYYSRGDTVHVTLTLEQYLAYAGETMEEYELAIGPKPVAEEVAV